MKKFTVEVTLEELEAMLHCLEYTDNHDDEGVRCSEPIAEQRSEAIGNLMQRLGKVWDSETAAPS